jgi:hypothetical protein
MSYQLRKQLMKTSTQDYFKTVSLSPGNELHMENPGVDFLRQPDNPLAIHYDFSWKNPGKGDLIYFNPMLSEREETNRLPSSERYYPVEFPYQSDQNYILNMDIPKGYRVDEMPKSARIMLNQTDGIFEYLVQQNSTNIQMRVHLQIKRTYFPVGEYANVRDFFSYVVKKEKEQIVFKKIP